LNERTPTWVPHLLLVLVGAPAIYLFFQVLYAQDERFVIKFLVLLAGFLVYAALLFVLKIDSVLHLVLFLSLFNIPLASLHTSSGNLVILSAMIAVFIRSTVFHDPSFSLHRFLRSGAALPLFLILLSYTASLCFVEKGWPSHLGYMQGLVCGFLLIVFIVGTVRTTEQFVSLNRVLLLVLILNLGYSVLFLFHPPIDALKASFLSQPIFEGEAATRLHGFSFRGETYGEFLLIACLVLVGWLCSGQGGKGKGRIAFLTAATVAALVLTRLRGANAVFLLGLLLLLMGSPSLRLAKKLALLLGIGLCYLLTLFVLSTATDQVTLLDRLYEFSDDSRKIGAIPTTRYYTWLPGIRFAQKHRFLGTGPSFKPYIDESGFQEVVRDQAAGDVTVWPHNLVILILCTVGIYGLASYLFLAFRVFRLRRVMRRLEPTLKNLTFGYFIAFWMYLIEAQKYDGSLRHPGTNFFLIAVLIGVLFTSETLAARQDEQGATGDGGGLPAGTRREPSHEWARRLREADPRRGRR